MHASRFDTLAPRSLTAAGSRRRALAGLLTGTVALMSGRSSGEAGKKKRKKKRCPAPTVCPPPDTCPSHTCCKCAATSPTPGCHIGGHAANLDEASVVCGQVCGGANHVGGMGIADPGFAVVCLLDGTCQVARCPI